MNGTCRLVRRPQQRCVTQTGTVLAGRIRGRFSRSFSILSQHRRAIEQPVHAKLLMSNWDRRGKNNSPKVKQCVLPNYFANGHLNSDLSSATVDMKHSQSALFSNRKVYIFTFRENTVYIYNSKIYLAIEALHHYVCKG